MEGCQAVVFSHDEEYVDRIQAHVAEIELGQAETVDDVVGTEIDVGVAVLDLATLAVEVPETVEELDASVGAVLLIAGSETAPETWSIAWKPVPSDTSNAIRQTEARPVSRRRWRRRIEPTTGHGRPRSSICSGRN
ncbi:hypothetical protein [Haloarcula halophila]|uniref:hypothetical protein n=1 Tax=Haloarcula TaxID=2237 RepID=UPI0023E44F88|nr:hypothetical protein [Halomicroarcula sp. DFY41]